MFVLSLFTDGVRIPPAEFETNQTEALSAVISAKYINKVRLTPAPQYNHFFLRRTSSSSGDLSVLIVHLALLRRTGNP